MARKEQDGEVGYPLAARADLAEPLPPDDPIAVVADPYRWLEDDDSPETAAWLAAQEELFAAHRATWPARGRFESRVRELTDAGYTGPPVYRGDRMFFTRRRPRAEHGQLLVSDDGDIDSARVLLDPMQLDPSGATTLDAYQPSKDGTLLAYQISSGGTEEAALRVLEVDSGELVDGPIDRTRYSPVAWLRDERAFYYVRRLAPDLVPADERQYHRRVYLHRLGTPPEDDVEIFGAGRPITSYYGVGVSWDGRWLTLSAADGTDPRNDVWLADLHASPPDRPALTPVITGADARTGVGVGRDGRLYVATDLDARRGRLAVADPADPGPDTWQDLIPERADAVLSDYLILDRGSLADRPRLLVSWTRHAVSEVTVHSLTDGAQIGSIELPGLGTVGGLLGRPDGGDEAWFSYTDHVTPPRVLHYDGVKEDLGIHALPPGTVDVPAVTTRQLEFASDDGTIVRAFVVARADLLDACGAPRAPMPTVLYGYGGFSHTMSPGYSSAILAWVEAGGVYSIAGLRGGAEEGEEWHRAGMLANKQNVFDDFHAAARALIERGWTTPGRLAIQGGSNGGLLVGAAMTQWPDLFGAVVCSAPLLDMVRYQLHGLGVSWTGEYGDANVPEELRWLLGYSPYHRVVEGAAYPATLFTVFAGDTRVAPLHAFKLTAALQYATSRPVAEAPILLRRELDVGHGGRSVSRSVGLTSDILGFLATRLGLGTMVESSAKPSGAGIDPPADSAT